MGVQLMQLHCSTFDAILVLTYLSFCVLALLNVVTAVFVSAALKTAEEDKMMMLSQQMWSFFEDADDDNSGTITWQEFKKYCKSPTFIDFLKKVDLQVDQAETLYKYLDEAGT